MTVYTFNPRRQGGGWMAYIVPSQGRLHDEMSQRDRELNEGRRENRRRVKKNPEGLGVAQWVKCLSQGPI